MRCPDASRRSCECSLLSAPSTLRECHVIAVPGAAAALFLSLGAHAPTRESGYATILRLGSAGFRALDREGAT